ncbi:hypothetical protein ACI79D_13995 [Geodermatophilus sp. SYSU D00708]
MTGGGGIGVYYARVNALMRIVPEPLRSAFLARWEKAGEAASGGGLRAAAAGDVANVMLSLLQIPNLSAVARLDEGTWFTYRGTVTVRGRQLRIRRPDLDVDLKAEVRSDCRLTATARTELTGTKSIALVGIIAGPGTFQLVVAGYSDEMIGMVHPGQLPEDLLSRWALDRDPGCRTEAESAAAVRASFTQMEELLVYRQGHRIFSTDAAVLAERQLQQFYDLLHRWILPSGMQTIREMDTGLGRVDFLIVDGAYSHAVEFKQVSDATAKSVEAIRRGWDRQLPTYMTARNASHGWLVCLCQGDRMTDDDVAAIRGIAGGVDPTSNRTLVLLDGRAQVSASRRASVPRLLSRED